jgi:hypothetical protein
MATSFVYNRVNVNGVPCIESKSITESTTTVVFNFNASPAVSPRFSGLIAVKIDETPTSDTLPVSFNVPSIAGTSIAVTGFNGAAVTGASLDQGIHLVFYDRENGILQLLV